MSLLRNCPNCNFELPIQKGRSSQQNKAYWKLIIEPLAEYLALERENVHEILKRKFLTEITWRKRKDGLMEEIPVIKSTTALTTSEYNEYCSQIRIWASQLGLWLSEPNEVPPGPSWSK